MIGISVFEDFIDATDKLFFSGSSAASQTRLHKPGGVVNITPGALVGDVGFATKPIVTLANSPAFGCRLRPVQVQGDQNSIFCWLTMPGVIRCGWIYDIQPYWKTFVSTDNVGDEYLTNILVEAGREYDLAVECDSTDIKFYLNGLLMRATAAPLLPINTLVYLDVRFFSYDIATAVRDVEIDYIYLSASR